jgi:hypothetical protein
LNKILKPIYDNLSNDKKKIIDWNWWYWSLLWKIAKDILLNKWNIWTSMLFWISDLVMDREKETDERTKDFFKALIVWYTMSGWFILWWKILKLAWYILSKQKQLLFFTWKKAFEHKWKIFLATMWSWVTYELFYDEGNYNEDKSIKHIENAKENTETTDKENTETTDNILDKTWKYVKQVIDRRIERKVIALKKGKELLTWDSEQKDSIEK